MKTLLLLALLASSAALGNIPSRPLPDLPGKPPPPAARSLKFRGWSSVVRESGSMCTITVTVTNPHAAGKPATDLLKEEYARWRHRRGVSWASVVYSCQFGDVRVASITVLCGDLLPP